MKWPKTIILIRHGESEYNNLKQEKASDPLYQEFIRAYEQEFNAPKTKELAVRIWQTYSLEKGDHETPLTPYGHFQSEFTGSKLKDLIELPDIIFVSPFIRTWQTQIGLAKGWPELTKVKIFEDERIREQEHGLSNLYADWRVFHTMHPEQKLLYNLQGLYRYRYPQGENVPDVRLRNLSFTSTLIREYAGKNVLVVTHHLNILAIRANYERLTEAQFTELDKNDKPKNCGVTIYRCNPNLGKDGKLILEKYNEVLYPIEMPRK